MGDERVEEPLVGTRVRAQTASGRSDGALEQHGRAVVERVRERHLGLHELEAVLVERKTAQERRGQGQRVHRRAGVMHEARQRELLRAAAAAEGVGALEHRDLTSGLRQCDRRGQPVGAGADDDRLPAGIRHSCDHG